MRLLAFHTVNRKCPSLLQSFLPNLFSEKDKLIMPRHSHFAPPLSPHPFLLSLPRPLLLSHLPLPTLLPPPPPPSLLLNPYSSPLLLPINLIPTPIHV